MENWVVELMSIVAAAYIFVRCFQSAASDFFLWNNRNYWARGDWRPIQFEILTVEEARRTKKALWRAQFISI